MHRNEFLTYRNNTFKETIPTFNEIMPNDLYISMNNPNVSDLKNYNSINNTCYNNLEYNDKIKKENLYTLPINLSYHKNRNRVQINQDIIGYNNLIINNNNYDTINTNQNKKKNNLNFYGTKNPNRIGIKNYIKISRINKKYSNNKNINSTSPNNTNNNNNNNYNSSLYQNEEIKYINMRLNFKLLEQKIEKLNNMILGENISLPPKNFNQTLNKMYKYKRKFNINISNSTNDNRFLSKNKNEIPLNKGLKKFLLMSNNNKNNKVNKDNSDYKNSLNQNKNSKKLFKRIAIKKKYLENKNNRYIKYDDSNYSNSDSEISELAGDIIGILKENLHKNKKTSDKEINSFSITNNKSISNDANNNNLFKSFDISKIKINKNKSKHFSISNPTELFYNPENKNKNDKSDKKSELSIEHVFSYNHMDNIDKNKKQIDINKSNDDIKDNKQILKFLLNDKDFIRKKLAQEIELMKLLKKNIKNQEESNKILNNKNDDNNDNNNNNSNDDKEKEEDGDGEKVINSLVSQITRSNQKENNDNYLNSSGRESNNNINNLPLKRNLNNYFIFEKEIKDNKKKKVTFDDKLIFINYNGKEKVPNLHISDSNNKNIVFKQRDISKYLYILASKIIKNNIKPIISNVNKIDYKSIINKKKINKSNNIIKRNIDFIKLAQKMNFSKEKYKTKFDLKSEKISRKKKIKRSTSKENNINNPKSKTDKKRTSNSKNKK